VFFIFDEMLGHAPLLRAFFAYFGVIDKMEAKKETLLSNRQNGGCFFSNSFVL